MVPLQPSPKAHDMSHKKHCLPALTALADYAQASPNIHTRLGLKPGDRMALNMPSIVPQIYWTEAAKRMGVVYTAVFGGFSDKTLSDRIADTGARVIVTSRDDRKLERALAMGADHAINYKTQDFVREVADATGGAGVNVILDMVAGAYVAREIDCLADEGRLVIIAVQGGVKAEFNAGLVLRRRLVITGSTLRPRPVAFKEAIAASLREKVWPLLEQGRIEPIIHSVFGAARAAEAHALMESNQHIGKIVLTWA